MSDSPQRLSIVYLHTHDLGRYTQPYGYDIPAPHLQELAERGVLFRQAFNVAPTCSPSRSGLVTGRWPHCNGMFGLTNQGWRLNDYSQHIARFLGRHGYETALAGAQHVAGQASAPVSELGYQHMLTAPKEEGGTGLAAAEAAAWFLEQERDRPFFLSVGFGEPHRHNRGDRKTFSTRYPAEPADIDDRYCQPMPHMPDNPITRREMANFRMGVEVMDEHFGKVLGALDRAGLADSTLVICTTDHGPGCPDMKCTLTDRGTGVMLVLAGPGAFSGGRVVDAMVSHLDIYPTVCDSIGLERPEWLQGQSLTPLLRGAQQTLHDCIFTEHNYHGEYRPMRAARTERWKYIRRFKTDVGVGVDGGPVDEMLRSYGWAERPLPEEELHDLVFDPHEAANVISDPACANVATDMRERLQRWMEETDDPLLRDAVPAPPAQT
ncbi:MAG: sulfatase [Armatimonadota bacterium]